MPDGSTSSGGGGGGGGGAAASSTPQSERKAKRRKLDPPPLYPVFPGLFVAADLALGVAADMAPIARRNDDVSSDVFAMEDSGPLSAPLQAPQRKCFAATLHPPRLHCRSARCLQTCWLFWNPGPSKRDHLTIEEVVERASKYREEGALSPR